MDQIVLLSEIHPRGAWLVAQAYDLNTGLSFSPAAQAQVWHGLPVSTIANHAAETIVRASVAQVLDQILEIHALATARGQYLVIRDWIYLDYIGIPFQLPTYIDSLTQILETQFTLHHAYLIRHPRDQWLSMSKLSVHHQVSLQHFLRGFHRYLISRKQSEVSTSNSTPSLFKYESFLQDPDLFLQDLTQHLGVPYDPNWSSKWQKYRQITGDRSEAQTHQVEILPPSRSPQVDPELNRALATSSLYAEILEITGYTHDL